MEQTTDWCTLALSFVLGKDRKLDGIRVSMFKLTNPENIQALPKVITAKLAEIDGDGSEDELWTG